MKNIACAVCGKTLYNVKSARQYCAECGKKVGLEKRRIRTGQKDKEKAGSHSPTLEEIMKEANKEGLQYAAYCKKHGLY